MSLRWRIGLVAIIAAAVVGGFMPHGVLSAAGTSATQVVQVAESRCPVPLNCVDATCGKGSPAPAAPSPGVALVAVVAASWPPRLAVAGSPPPAPAQLLALPAGARDPLFHPPQFS